MSNLILFGFHGCGKTFFGKMLARKLNCNFLDTDTILENLYNLNFGFLPSESTKIPDEIDPLFSKRIAEGTILEGKENRDRGKIVDSERIKPKTQVYGQKLSCREIFKRHGEQFFRSLETLALKSLTEVQNSVIALGGGTILQDTNYQILKNMGTLIYLEVDKETLKERMLKNGLPAYLNSLDSFDDLYEKRKIIYEKYCHKKLRTFTNNIDLLH